MPATYLVLWHRYINEWNIHQQILLGFYTSHTNAEKAIELVRENPGFRDHPEGFVITEGTIDRADMANAFVTVRENGRERDEPIDKPASAG